jgi:hypothetical protein
VNHFKDEDWLDFVRGTIPEMRATSLEEHLKAGCAECTRAKKFWETVSEVARREAGAGIPPDVTAEAAAIFADWRHRALLPGHSKAARPIFDSLLEPLPAGVRSGAPAARRVIERSDRWTIDLRIESEPGDRISVAGQLLRPGWRAEEWSPARVLLVSGQAPLAETEANGFGEFHLTFRSGPDLTAYIAVPGQQVISAPIPQPEKPLVIRKRNSKEPNE